MDSSYSTLHQNAFVVDAHDHLMIEVAKHYARGERDVLRTLFWPRIQAGGVNVIMMVVGGDNTSLTNGSDNMLWGTLVVMDALFEELKSNEDRMALCRSAADIDGALAAGKVAVVMGLEGAHPLEGSVTSDSMATLHMLYQLGLRSVQLVDNRRNRVGDGAAEARTRGGLSSFGIQIVKECNRLGILIDVAHLTDAGFWDVIETSEDPVVDSHSNARGVCDHPRNLSDERIKAMTEHGGVIGLSASAALISADASRPANLDDFIRHVDYIAELAGIDYVALGPDHAEDMGWSPAPGWIGGLYYGLREGGFFVQDFEDMAGFPHVTEALLRHGYSEGDIRKILGENLLRLYRKVLS